MDITNIVHAPELELNLTLRFTIDVDDISSMEGQRKE